MRASSPSVKITNPVQKPSKKLGLNRNRQEWGENKKIALIPVVSRLCLVAEAGFEPHDLRVMRSSHKLYLKIDVLGRTGTDNEKPTKKPTNAEKNRPCNFISTLV